MVCKKLGETPGFFMHKFNLYERKDGDVFCIRTFDVMKRVSTQCPVKLEDFVVL
jgi:hypothetical protein